MSDGASADALRVGLFEQLVAAASRTTEDHVAIVDGDVHLTYPRLLQAAGDFSQTLEAAGISPGDPVAVILGNRREFLIAAFGIWKRGAVLTPLNPQLREAEVASCLRDTSARALVTTSRSERLIRALHTHDVRIDHTWAWLHGTEQWSYERSASTRAVAPVDGSAFAVDSDWPAVTQYSTGSTGRPRRVTRTHGQLLREVSAVAALMQMTAEDRILGAAPFFHSYGLVVSALLTLLSAGTLYTLDAFLPGTAGRLVEREGVSGLPGVPLMFQLLAECKQDFHLSSLRFCLSAGAPLAASTAERFSARYGKRIRRLYGSTETGVISISDDGPGTDDVSSVGAPIPGVSVEVLDEAGHIRTAGQDGLIRIRSKLAATGYDGQCLEGDSYFTEQGFIPGDEGCIGADNRLVLRGRRRHFINTHGYKVDPSEVEQVLLELPGVTEAIVLGISDRNANEQIKAVLIAPSGISQQAVREHCLRRLAPFKCPQLIEFRTELPRNLLGKVLRKYLLDETTTVPPP